MYAILLPTLGNCHLILMGGGGGEDFSKKKSGPGFAKKKKKKKIPGPITERKKAWTRPAEAEKER